MNIVVICDLWSNNEIEEQDKRDFYNDLQDVMEQLPGRDENIVMWDNHAKMVECNVGYEDVMGRFE